MAWYWIVLIVLGGLFVLTYVIFQWNLDMKLVAAIYKMMNKLFDKKQGDIKF